MSSTIPTQNCLAGQGITASDMPAFERYYLEGIMKKTLVVFLISLSIALGLYFVPAYRPQRRGVVEEGRRHNWSRYLESPLKFLTHEPKVAPVKDKKMREAVARDFTKWMRWVIEPPYLPSNEKILRNIKLYSASVHTGGVDMAYLAYRAKGAQIRVSQSVISFCVQMSTGVIHENLNKEVAIGLSMQDLSRIIRPDILKEKQLPSPVKKGGSWVMRDKTGTRGFLDQQGGAICFSFVKATVRQPELSPSIIPPDSWFKVVEEKVMAGSDDMKYYPRLASPGKVLEYLKKIKK
jgi:hypothetical protein